MDFGLIWDGDGFHLSKQRNVHDQCGAQLFLSHVQFPVRGDRNYAQEVSPVAQLVTSGQKQQPVTSSGQKPKLKINLAEIQP